MHNSDRSSIPIDQALCIKMYENNARSKLFLRIANRSIEMISQVQFLSEFSNFGLNCAHFRPFTYQGTYLSTSLKRTAQNHFSLIFTKFR